MKVAASNLISGAALLVLIQSASACDQDAPPSESLAAPGVLMCANTAAFGQVESVQASGSSTAVQFTPERWVVPDSGSSPLSFTVDSDDEGWRVGDTGLLVLKDGSPALLLDTAQADEVEAAWDGTSDPESDDCDS